MSGKVPGRSGRVAVGAFLTLLACGLVWPSTASAACSHAIAAQASAELSEFASLGRVGALADSATPPSERPTRCSGSLCSGSTAIPLAPAPAPAPQGETWAILESFTPRPDPVAGRMPADPSRAAPRQSAPPIFHPPRTNLA